MGAVLPAIYQCNMTDIANGTVSAATGKDAQTKRYEKWWFKLVDFPFPHRFGPSCIGCYLKDSGILK